MGSVHRTIDASNLICGVLPQFLSASFSSRLVADSFSEHRDPVVDLTHSVQHLQEVVVLETSSSSALDKRRVIPCLADVSTDPLWVAILEIFWAKIGIVIIENVPNVLLVRTVELMSGARVTPATMILLQEINKLCFHNQILIKRINTK